MTLEKEFFWWGTKRVQRTSSHIDMGGNRWEKKYYLANNSFGSEEIKFLLSLSGRRNSVYSKKWKHVRREGWLSEMTFQQEAMRRERRGGFLSLLGHDDLPKNLQETTGLNFTLIAGATRKKDMGQSLHSSCLIIVLCSAVQCLCWWSHHLVGTTNVEGVWEQKHKN